jgi:acyl-CoA thioester hydrolase
MPRDSIETNIAVRYEETDRAGVAYYANYLVWFEVARTDHFKKKGMNYRSMEEQGFHLAVVSASCKYISPVTYDDEITVRSRVSSCRSASLVFEYEIVKGDGLVATGATTLAFLDSDRKIRRLPEKIKKALGS